MRLPDSPEAKWRTETFAKEREAKAALARWRHEEDTPPVEVASEETLAEYLRYWLTHVKVGGVHVRPSTHRSYREVVEGQLIPGLGHIPLRNLTTEQIQRWESAESARLTIRQARKAGSRQHHKADIAPITAPAPTVLSARMVRYPHGLLKQALTHAVLSGRLARNPMEGVVPPRKAPGRRELWTPDQVRRFLAAVQTAPYAPLWEVALATGLRIGELIALRWSDLDLALGRIAVTQAFARSGVPQDTGDPKSRAGTRVVTVTGHTLTVLRAHYARAPWPEGLVFPSRAGTMILPQNVHKVYSALKRDLALPPARFHDLRVLHTTTAILAGMPVNAVSERIGHADIRTTLSLYVRSNPAAEAMVAATVDGLFFPA
jgi:integrase